MRHALLLLTLLLCGCDATGPDSSQFAEPRYYLSPVYGTCEGAQEFPCQQIAVFCPDGTATFTVTDIMNSARYSIRGGLLTMRFPRPGGDVRGPVVFQVSADRERLTHLQSGGVWERRLDEEAQATQYVCD